MTIATYKKSTHPPNDCNSIFDSVLELRQKFTKNDRWKVNLCYIMLVVNNNNMEFITHDGEDYVEQKQLLQ